MCEDITYFYLRTPMNRYDYMRIPVKDIPEEMMLEYNLAGHVYKTYVLVEIRKFMYGLLQAGKIAHDRLVRHIAKEGY